MPYFCALIRYRYSAVLNCSLASKLQVTPFTLRSLSSISDLALLFCSHNLQSGLFPSEATQLHYCTMKLSISLLVIGLVKQVCDCDCICYLCFFLVSQIDTVFLCFRQATADDAFSHLLRGDRGEGDSRLSQLFAFESAPAVDTSKDLADARADATHRTLMQYGETIFGDLGGMTLGPGTYEAAAAITQTGTLTLNAENDPDAKWYFNFNAAFSTAADSTIDLIAGGLPANVHWNVNGAVTTGAGSTLVGNIVAAGAVVLGADSQVDGSIESTSSTLVQTERNGGLK
jgi:hypothetical protein